MQELLDFFYVEGDILQTICKMVCMFVIFIVVLDIVYVIKSGMKASF